MTTTAPSAPQPPAPSRSRVASDRSSDAYETPSPTYADQARRDSARTPPASRAPPAARTAARTASRNVSSGPPSSDTDSAAPSSRPRQAPRTPRHLREAAPPRDAAMESPAPRSMMDLGSDSPGSSSATEEENEEEEELYTATPAPRASPRRLMNVDTSAQTSQTPQRRPRSPPEDTDEDDAKRPCTAHVPRPLPNPRDPRIARRALQDACRDQTPTYAQTAATPGGSQQSTSCPADRQQQGTPPPPTPAKKIRYPPLIVELLPNWARHMGELKRRLGRAANARPYGKGMRFSPKEEAEYRIIQAYLTELEKTEGVSWHSYSLPTERSLKVAIRGLPSNAQPEEVEEALREMGYEPEYVRNIRARGDRPGCILLAVLKRTPGITPDIYNIKEILGVTGVIVEGWRGKKRPAQCHRCQKFRHSSHQCHRPVACVRCGEGHLARECPRPKEEPATCANCGGNHPANHINCPVYRREARNKKAGPVATSGAPKRGAEPIKPVPTGEAIQQGSLMAQANPPTARGNYRDPNPERHAKKKKKRRKKRAKGDQPKGEVPPPPPPEDLPPPRQPRNKTSKMPPSEPAHPVAAPALQGKKAKAPVTHHPPKDSAPSREDTIENILNNIHTVLITIRNALADNKSDRQFLLDIIDIGLNASARQQQIWQNNR